jgi:iron(III) transport system permease protein
MTLSRWRSPQAVAGALVALAAGVLVLYPVAFLLQAALNTGDPEARPPTKYGLDNFAGLLEYPQIILNTLTVSVAATVMALVLGFVMAWIITRTNVPGRRMFEQMMVVPYYLTPLLGALAWSLLGTPESGFLNQVFRALGGKEYLIDINTPYGIAWVMALFEGSVAFVMIGAVMKSMDPALEEASQVMGASRLRTMLRVTLPLVLPGVLGAAVFVFAEMLGSFAAALVLGLPNRYYVVTTAIYQLVQQYPPKIPIAAAMGTSLFVVMFVTLFIYRRIILAGSYVTITGKAFRPRVNDVGRLRWLLLAICLFYLFCSVVLPLLTLFYASIQKISTAFPAASNFTTEHFYKAFTMNAATTALGNSLWLALWTASIGVLLMGLISWIIYRSRLPGSAVIEYIVMFPQSVPRLIFAFGMMWAWLIFPIPIYGTLWLLLIAYLTVFLPLGVRTISGVMLQIDKSLEECAQMCGAGWGYRIRTVTVPLLWPGLIAAWLLLFVASIRELGASILLMGPHSKVITPSIVESWFASSTELTAAMALIQTAVVAVAVSVLLAVTRRATTRITD